MGSRGRGVVRLKSFQRYSCIMEGVGWFLVHLSIMEFHSRLARVKAKAAGGVVGPVYDVAEFLDLLRGVGVGQSGVLVAHFPLSN